MGAAAGGLFFAFARRIFFRARVYRRSIVIRLIGILTLDRRAEFLSPLSSVSGPPSRHPGEAAVYRAAILSEGRPRAAASFHGLPPPAVAEDEQVICAMPSPQLDTFVRPSRAQRPSRRKLKGRHVDKGGKGA